MKGLRTFPKGGIHPPGRKNLTNQKAIRQVPLPAVCTVPMQQHLGAPANCVVEKGDTVSRGMVIGEQNGFISSGVHSPVDGIVQSITEVYLPNGIASKAVVIETAEEQSGVSVENRDWKSLDKEELIGIIKDSGVVGMGGATFPAYVKYTIPKGKSARHLVINGVECEPYLSADHRLMLESRDAIIEGIRILQYLTGAEKVAIGIEINKPDAIKAMREALKESGLKGDVVPLKLKYPQGDEKQLLKAVTGLEVPSGGLPIDIGAVVSNVGTVNAVYEAVVQGKPLYERVVSVSGGAVKNPSNVKAVVGTTVQELIDFCGGLKQEPEKIVIGGPMMGFTIYDTETPIAKGTSGILLLTKKEVAAGSSTACLSCGRCVSACPMGLNPTRMFKNIDHGDYQAAMDNGLMDCKECGCCAYSCPAHIPLVQGMRLGKKMGRKKKVG